MCQFWHILFVSRSSRGYADVTQRLRKGSAEVTLKLSRRYPEDILKKIVIFFANYSYSQQKKKKKHRQFTIY